MTLFASNVQKITVSLASCTETGVIVEDTTTGTPKITLAASAAIANTFGAWVQHDASLDNDSWIAFITVNCSSFAVPFNLVVEIGIGAAASESTIIRLSSYFARATTVGARTPAVFALPIPIKLSAGTRIAVRTSDSNAGALNHYISVPYYQGLET